jgi:hypothetical protein
VLDRLHDPANQLERPFPEGHLRTFPGSEEVGDQGERRVPDVREEEHRPTGGNHPAMDLRHFKVSVHLRFDGGQVSFALKFGEKLPQIRKDVLVSIHPSALSSCPQGRR